MNNYNIIYKMAYRYYLKNNNFNHGCHTIIAIITDINGSVIAKGVNSYSKTHPVQANYAKKTGNQHKIFLHAEIAALVKCRKNPYNIYIFRFDKTGNLSLAKPCPICTLAIKESGVKKIVYTINNGIIEELI